MVEDLRCPRTEKYKHDCRVHFVAALLLVILVLVPGPGRYYPPIPCGDGERSGAFPVWFEGDGFGRQYGEWPGVLSLYLRCGVRERFYDLSHSDSEAVQIGDDDR